jgi:small ligand-binding sensory domain FIST
MRHCITRSRSHAAMNAAPSAEAKLEAVISGARAILGKKTFAETASDKIEAINELLENLELQAANA